MKHGNIFTTNMPKVDIIFLIEKDIIKPKKDQKKKKMKSSKEK